MNIDRKHTIQSRVGRRRFHTDVYRSNFAAGVNSLTSAEPVGGTFS